MKLIIENKDSLSTQPLYYHLNEQCIEKADDIKSPKDIKYLYMMDILTIKRAFEIFKFSTIMSKNYEVTYYLYSLYMQLTLLSIINKYLFIKFRNKLKIYRS